ncbi:hypothetical protein D3C78_1649950 [compost metagenome]
MAVGQLHGAIHHPARREIADTLMRVPLFNGSERQQLAGFGVRHDIAGVQLLNKAWETVNAVGVNAVGRGVGEHARTVIGGGFRHAPRQQHAFEFLFQIGVTHSHAGSPLRHFCLFCVL